ARVGDHKTVVGRNKEIIECKKAQERRAHAAEQTKKERASQHWQQKEQADNERVDALAEWQLQDEGRERHEGWHEQIAQRLPGVTRRRVFKGLGCFGYALHVACSQSARRSLPFDDSMAPSALPIIAHRKF